MERFKTTQCRACGAVCEKIGVAKKRFVLVDTTPYLLRPNEEGRETFRDFGYTKDGRFFRGKIVNRAFVQPDIKYAEIYRLHNCRAAAARAQTFIR